MWRFGSRFCCAAIFISHWRQVTFRTVLNTLSSHHYWKKTIWIQISWTTTDLFQTWVSYQNFWNVWHSHSCNGTWTTPTACQNISQLIGGVTAPNQHYWKSSMTFCWQLTEASFLHSVFWTLLLHLIPWIMSYCWADWKIGSDKKGSHCPGLDLIWRTGHTVSSIKARLHAGLIYHIRYRKVLFWALCSSYCTQQTWQTWRQRLELTCMHMLMIHSYTCIDPYWTHKHLLRR